jgi:hypothetical protein
VDNFIFLLFLSQTKPRTKAELGTGQEFFPFEAGDGETPTYVPM